MTAGLLVVLTADAFAVFVWVRDRGRRLDPATAGRNASFVGDTIRARTCHPPVTRQPVDNFENVSPNVSLKPFQRVTPQ